MYICIYVYVCTCIFYAHANMVHISKYTFAKRYTCNHFHAYLAAYLPTIPKPCLDNTYRHTDGPGRPQWDSLIPLA